MDRTHETYQPQSLPPVSSTGQALARPGAEALYLDTIGLRIAITPHRAQALIQELTAWLAEKAQAEVNRQWDAAPR